MRAVIAHPPRQDILRVRRILLSAGFECERHDCVEWNQLEARLAGGVVDLLVLQVSDLTAAGRETLCAAAQLTAAPKLLIGSGDSQHTAALVRHIDAADFIDEDHLAPGLEQALERVQETGLVAAQRGAVYSVWSPTPGTGVTTVAANLADALARTSDPGVAVLELTSGIGRLASLLELELPHAAEQVCGRWESLDSVCFQSGLATHTSGLRVFANDPESRGNEAFCPASARRLLSLTRTAHSSTVVALGSQWDEAAMEVLRLSDRVLMLMRPDVPSVRRVAWAYVQAVDAGVADEQIEVLVNRWGLPGGLTRDQVVSTLGAMPMEFIPDEPAATTKAANEGCLLRTIGRGKIVRRLEAVATSLRSRHALAI